MEPAGISSTPEKCGSGVQNGSGKDKKGELVFLKEPWEVEDFFTNMLHILHAHSRRAKMLCACVWTDAT